MKLTNKYRVLLLLSSTWMMGTGFRFIMMKNSIYQLNLFDTFFDWGVLIVLGFLLFIWVIYSFLKTKEKVF